MMERIRNSIHAGAVYCHATNIEARVKVLSCHDDKGVYMQDVETEERVYLSFEDFRRNFRRVET